MGRSDRDTRCMKHPDHRESKGVCPYCLRKKLSHLRFSSSSQASSLASSLSVSSSDDSELSSYSVSPPSFRKKETMVSLFKRGSSSRAPFVKPRETITKNMSLLLAVGEEQSAETDDSELSSYSVSPPSFRKKTMMASLFKRGSSSRARFVKPWMTIAKSRSLVLAVGEEQLAETEKAPKRDGKKGVRSSWFKLLGGSSGWSKGKEKVL